MTDILGVASSISSAPATHATGGPRTVARAVAAGAIVVIVAAALGVATIVRPSTAPAADPALDAARAHVMWLHDEHAAGANVDGAAARQMWLLGEHASYGASAEAAQGSGWQGCRTFRLEEEGYNR
jgi:hypothetical protein